MSSASEAGPKRSTCASTAGHREGRRSRADAQNGGKALLIGNGGSAAIVSHMHNDLCKMVGVRAMCLTETPLMTALANDDGYETVFHKPISMWADRGDLLIAVSKLRRIEQHREGGA